MILVLNQNHTVYQVHCWAL